MGRPDDGAGPVLLTDHLAALLAQDPIHAETHDRPEVSEQDAGTGLTGHAPTFPVRHFAGQRLQGSTSGILGYPFDHPLPSITSSTRSPGTWSWATASRPSDVRAIRRWVPGGTRLNRNWPSGRLEVHLPTSGMVTHTSASGAPFVSLTRPIERCSSTTLPGGPSDISVRMV